MNPTEAYVLCRSQGGDVLDLTQVWQQAGLGVDQLGIDLNKWVHCISRGYLEDIYNLHIHNI